MKSKSKLQGFNWRLWSNYEKTANSLIFSLKRNCEIYHLISSGLWIKSIHHTSYVQNFALLGANEYKCILYWNACNCICATKRTQIYANWSKKHPIKSGYLAVSKTNRPPSVIFHKRNQKEPRKYSLSKQREECVPVEMAQFTYTIESELWMKCHCSYLALLPTSCANHPLKAGWHLRQGEGDGCLIYRSKKNTLTN